MDHYLPHVSRSGNDPWLNGNSTLELASPLFFGFSGLEHSGFQLPNLSGPSVYSSLASELLEDLAIVICSRC